MEWLRDFWAHALVQISAWLVSILLGGYLGYLVNDWSEKRRELIYTVLPGRSTIVKAGEVSDLTVSYKGEPVTTDVSAVQVYIWNEGRENIRQSHMHEPLVISTAESTPILEAKILQYTRPDQPKIVAPYIDMTQKDHGRITVLWHILEHRDGMSIQLTVKGKPNIKVSAAAAIEDQGDIREIPFIRHADRRADGMFAAGLVGTLCFFISLWYIGERVTARRRETWERHATQLSEEARRELSPLLYMRFRSVDRAVLIGINLLIAAMGVLAFLSWWRWATPPLGF
jgi:hypothetical protein